MSNFRLQISPRTARSGCVFLVCELLLFTGALSRVYPLKHLERATTRTAEKWSMIHAHVHHDTILDKGNAITR